MSAKPRLRCAIYTRKSSEEGLEQDFNSLDAQREACEAYIKSQAHEGWTLVRDHFDDGGFSGGNMERPALKALMRRVDAAEIDIIVVYKIDRLTRSLTDFARLAETFDAHKVSFVSVTQQFNTTSSMGRLMLNVLLSFAQFEREITGERIRDKIAASKKKGMWMGGVPPIGYDIVDRHLLVNRQQAATVQATFRLYLEAGSVPALTKRLVDEGITTTERVSTRGNAYGGRPFARGHLYKLLSNPIYIGRIPHKGQSHPGMHKPIIDQDVWNATQSLLAQNTQGHRTHRAQQAEWLLDGLLGTEAGSRLVPSHATKSGRRYRYYIEPPDAAGEGKAIRLPAVEIETATILGLRSFLGDRSALLAAYSGLPNMKPDTLLFQAHTWAAALDQHPAQLRELVQSVIYCWDRLELTIRADRLTESRSTTSSEPFRTVRNTVPLLHHRRGRQMKLVVPGHEHQRLPNGPLVTAIVRAWDWARQLTSGEVSSIAEICRAEGFSDTYVGQLLPLAFLAPDVVESILEGAQSPELSADWLIWEAQLSAEWSVQGKTLNARD